MSRVLVSAHGLGVRFGERWVVRDVSFEVAAGTIVTLIGPNGAGKSTLLRTVLGLVPATTGTVTRAPNLRIGYMPQRLQVEATLPLSVTRFLALSGVTDRREIAAALKETGADHVTGSTINALSGGELQRVLLARALLRRPQLLVLDEPMQGVDVVGQSELYQLIATIRQRHECGVLLVSHDLHLVMAATDHVLCVNGHVCCSGHPETVSRHPEYLALFGGHELEGLAVYTHHHDHAHALDGHVAPLEKGHG